MTNKEALDILYKGIAPDSRANDECIKLCKKALENQIQNQWISVKDKLPEENKTVLLYAAHDMWCGFYHPTRGWVVIGLGISGSVDDSITHWMPLPQSPKEDS